MSDVTSFEDTSYQANPELDQVLSDIILLKTLIKKVSVIQKWYDQDQDIDKLYVSSETYFLIIKLIDKLRISYVSDESKIYLSQTTSFLYEDAIKLSLKLYQLTNNEKFKKNAFVISEKGKAGILLSAINDSKAKKMADVPDSLLKQEEFLLTSINEVETKLYQELDKGVRARQRYVDQYNKELFNLKNQSQNFIKDLEKNYHNYFLLKYNITLPNIVEIQEKLLKGNDGTSDRTLLEYFVGRSSIFIFVVTPDTCEVIEVPNSSTIQGEVHYLRNSIKFDVLNNIVPSLRRLYTSLIQPIEPFLVGEELIIVPDGVLNLLPYDMILTEEVDLDKEYTEKSFKSLPYLMNSYNVRYSYSTELLLGLSETEVEASKFSFLGLAPVFDTTFSTAEVYGDKELIEGFRHDTLLYDSLTNHGDFAFISYSDDEIKYISNKMKKDKSIGLTHQFAQEAYVKDTSYNQASILHFASHSILMDNDVEGSGIVLAKDKSGVDDGILRTSEIYNLNISAEFVCLSACETGLGKIISGEGLIGFSRAFFYAGAKTILVSLWKVPDEPTYHLMKKIYKYQAKGKYTKSEAMNKAKRKLSKSKFSSPKNWAAFLSLGM